MNNVIPFPQQIEVVQNDDPYHHAVCDDCYPEDATRDLPPILKTWCGKTITSDQFPPGDGTEDIWSTPPDACPDCQSRPECAVCGRKDGE